MKTPRHAGPADPTWLEVILGVGLSIALGAVLAAVFLVFKPVVILKAPAKAADVQRDTVYYLEGTRQAGNARQAAAKQQQWVVQGASVLFNEDEINTLLAPSARPAGAKPSGADAAPEQVLTPGKPNVRVRDGVVQLGLPMKLNLYGLTADFLVQVRGTLAKRGDLFVLVPSEFYVGSCPVQRLPLLPELLLRRGVAAMAVPAPLAAAWAKLADAAVDGSTVVLTMP